jgi:hypothetical protein
MGPLPVGSRSNLVSVRVQEISSRGRSKVTLLPSADFNRLAEKDEKKENTLRNKIACQAYHPRTRPYS